MNLQETHILRNLDNVMVDGQTRMIGTQFGDVLIKKTQKDYLAILEDSSIGIYDSIPSVAVLRLGEKLKIKFNN